MALTIYNDDGWDSFVTIANADTILTNNIPSTQRTLWEALADTDKEIYLRQATELIRTKITLPYELEDDLQKATAYLANYSVGKDMTTSDGESNLKRKNIAQTTIEKEYFYPGSKSNAFPDNVIALLSQYGYGGANSFTLDRA